MFSFKKKPERPFISAVIVAAGSARRMQGLDKQQVMIDQVPVVARSILCFADCPMITEVVVVCREEQIVDYYRIVQEYAIDKVVSVVKGAAQRQYSVFQGIAACSPQTEFFAIHDGARPLVLNWEIEGCIAAAMQYGAAATGTPVKDTIKQLTEDGFVASTLDRSALMRIATPQVFAADLYREAMQRAQETRCVYTDDCQLVERCGYRVWISPGSYENIKITTPEDLAIAQAILTYREEGVEQWQVFE